MQTFHWAPLRALSNMIQMYVNISEKGLINEITGCQKLGSFILPRTEMKSMTIFFATSSNFQVLIRGPHPTTRLKETRKVRQSRRWLGSNRLQIISLGLSAKRHMVCAEKVLCLSRAEPPTRKVVQQVRPEKETSKIISSDVGHWRSYWSQSKLWCTA